MIGSYTCAQLPEWIVLLAMHSLDDLLVLLIKDPERLLSASDLMLALVLGRRLAHIGLRRCLQEVHHFLLEVV